jgi:diguanylate cyclase (GGDEF)-like protein
MSVDTWTDDNSALSIGLPSRAQRWKRMLPGILMAVIALMGASIVTDIIFDYLQETAETEIRFELEQARLLQMALIDTRDGAQGFVTSGGLEYLERYLSGAKALASTNPALLRDLDQYASAQPDTNAAAISGDVATLQTMWEKAVRLTGDNQRTSAEATALSAHTWGVMERLRGKIAGYLDQLTAKEAEMVRRGDLEQEALQVLNVVCAVIAIAGMGYAFRSIMRAIGSGSAARQQVEQLFSMTDMLQSATGQEDTNEVLRTTAASLLPGVSGALYVFNNSRDRLDLSTRWGHLSEDCADHITPASCWALKRGKPHLNRLEDGALRCTHASKGQATLEIPMAARGQLYGLLEVISGDADATTMLGRIHPIASAMSDAMSLALSSIALREQLRNQALRDPLTGLYNRRFLEEMLGRMCVDAERRKTSISAIMIDLDHFKKLNDQHGHAAGDAVLRDVAAAILSCLRSVDVACRYGGEEMAVLLSDCSLEVTTGKAEQIRSRISELARAGGAAVTASLGVASIPETTSQASDLLPAADAALYEAKQQGRDRVVAARVRSSAHRLSLIEAGATLPPAE